MTSRRDLYAAGLPFGDGATRRKLGGGYVCGLGGDSSSATTSDTTTLTAYTDSRMVVDGGGLGVNTAGGAANLTVNSTANTIDAGAVQAARDVSMTALNDNAFNTASMIAAASKLGDQQVKALELNNRLAGDIAAAGAAGTAALAGANAQSFDSLLSSTLSLFKETNKGIDRNLDLTQHLADGAASAYSDATSQANGNKQLLIVGLAVVGIVAAFAFTKGKL